MYAQGCLFVFLTSCECGCGAGSAKTAVKPLRHAASTVAMFHLYNPNSGEHFYTWNAAEIDSLVCAGWESEGRDWATSAGGDPAYCLPIRARGWRS